MTRREKANSKLMEQIDEFEEILKIERNRYEKSPPIYMHNRYQNIDVKPSIAKLDPFWKSKTNFNSPQKSPKN